MSRTGSLEQHTLANEAEDLLAVVNTARSRTFARIGLLGHSEGSMVSARVAETTDEAVAPAVTRDVSEFIARQR